MPVNKAPYSHKHLHRFENKESTKMYKTISQNVTRYKPPWKVTNAHLLHKYTYGGAIGIGWGEGVTDDRIIGRVAMIEKKSEPNGELITERVDSLLEIWLIFSWLIINK